MTSASQVLDDEEQTRTRLLGLSGMGLDLLGVFSLPLLGGSPRGRTVFLVGLAVHALANFGLFYVGSKKERFRERWLLLLWSVGFLALHMVIYYFGTLTVASGALLLGLYVVGTTRFEKVALAAYIVVAVGTGLSAALQLAGWIPDIGILPLHVLSTGQAIAMLVLIEAMFLAVRLISLEARTGLARAVDQLREATRAVAQREALLEEAREEFRRAHLVGGPGRFTDVQLGRFHLGNVLGRGGMGEIYEGQDTERQVAVAIKVLSREATGNEHLLKRFFQECAIVSRLRSPHIVEVVAIGTPPEEIPFIAMERLVGRDLAMLLADRRVLSVPEVARMVREVGAGLEAAADAGVVHRDIKPQNIFHLEPESGGVLYKILDFGVSKLAYDDAMLTRGHVLGTPGYMAPEQASGLPVEHATDLYSLGAVAYRCLVGRTPFAGRDTPRVLLDVMGRMPARPSSLTSLHPDVDAVFAIALAKAPGDRFETAATLAEALEQAAQGQLSPGRRTAARELLAKTPWRERGMPV